MGAWGAANNPPRGRSLGKAKMTQALSFCSPNPSNTQGRKTHGFNLDNAYLRGANLAGAYLSGMLSTLRAVVHHAVSSG